MTGLPKMPAWRRAGPIDRLHNHMAAEAMLEREIDGTLQVIERVRVRTQVSSAYGRPFYRMLEVRGETITIVHTADLLKEARFRFDQRAAKGLRARKTANRSA